MLESGSLHIGQDEVAVLKTREREANPFQTWLRRFFTYNFDAAATCRFCFGIGEAVPAFENMWIECLGDLGRYQVATEDDEIRDKEVWTGVACHWYSKASDKAPTTGHLYLLIPQVHTSTSPNGTLERRCRCS